MANLARTILGDSYRDRYPDNYRTGNRAPGAGSDAYWQQVAHKDHWRSKEAHGAFDEFGFTEFLPDENAGPYAQHEANRIAANRNARLGREAGAALYGGLHNLQSYRPGGAAAMASGMYGQQAATLLSMRQAAPDLMTMWRKVEADRARKDAKRAALLSSGISAVASLGSAAIGGALGGGFGLGVNVGLPADQGMEANAGAADFEQQTGMTDPYHSAVGDTQAGGAAQPAEVAAGGAQAVPAQAGGVAPGAPAPGAPEGAPAGGPAPEGAGAGAGGPAPGGAGGTGGGPAGGEAGPGVGGDGRQMGAPLPMGGLGMQGAMGFSAPGALNSYAQITGVPQEIAYAQLYREAGLEDGFWPALHARLNQMLGEDYIEASSWDDGGEYV